MTRWRTVLDEAIGLFVDDGSLAVAVVVWLLLCGVVIPWLPLPGWAPPVLLFAGLIAILAESVLRAYRRM